MIDGLHAVRVPSTHHVWFEGERHHYVDETGEVTEQDGAEAVCMLCMQKRRRGAPRSTDGEVKYW